jgi:hypothetical protein
VDPDTWQNTPEYIKGIYGLDRNASDLDVAGAVLNTAYEPVSGEIQTIVGGVNLATNARARAAFAHNLSLAALGHAISQPWLDYVQGLQCRDAYLIGRGTRGIANELLVADGLYRGGQAVGGLLRGSGASEAVLEATSEEKLLNAQEGVPEASDTPSGQPTEPSEVIFRIVEQDGYTIHLYGNGPNGEVEIMTRMYIEDDTLYLQGLDIYGGGPGSQGLRALRDLARAFGKDQGVSMVIIEGTPRAAGSGANPGHLPRPIRIPVK